MDNSDRYALATVSVSRGGAGAVRFRRRQFAAAVSEAAAPGHVLLTLHTAPPPRPATQVHRYYTYNIVTFINHTFIG